MKPSFARVTSFLPPLIWTAFLWLYIIVASDVEFQPFYVLVRGKGAVIDPSAISLFSTSFDLDLLLAVGGVLLAMHLVMLGRNWRPRAWTLTAWLAFGACLVGFAITQSVAIVLLLGISFAFAVMVEAQLTSKMTGLGTGRVLAYFALCVSAVLAALALVSAGRWLSAGFDGSVPLSGPSWGTAYAGLQLIGVLDPILPQLALLFFFAWALRLVLSPLLRKARTSDGDRSAWEGALARSGLGWPGRGLSLLLLGIAVVLAAFVTICPYLPAVNPGSSLVGVDVYFCYSHVLDSTLLPSGAGPGAGACVGSAASYAVQRLGAVEMLKGLAYLSGSNNLALETAPAILAVLLAVSTYLLVLEGTGRQFTAGVSALLSSVSPQVIAGLNAGFIANWLAIGVAFLFFAALLHALRTRRLAYALLSYAIFVGLLFIHPWTWAFTLVILVAYLSLSLIESAWARDLRSKKLEGGILASLLVAGLAADAVRSLLPEGSGLATALSTLAPGLALSNIPLAVTNLRLTFVTFLLGAYADPVLFALGVVGVLAIPSLSGRFGKLLLTWVAAVSFAIVLLPPASVDTLQARVIYDVPLQIFAALGLVAIIDLAVRPLWDGTDSGARLARLMVALILIGVVGLLLGFALDNAGFLYPPGYLR